MWEAIRTHDPRRGALITWVWFKVEHRLKDAARFEPPPGDEMPENIASDADVESAFESAERVAALREAVRGLAPGHREAVEWFLRTDRVTGRGGTPATKSWESRRFKQAVEALKERMQR